MPRSDLRQLPSVSALLADPRLSELPHAVAVSAARAAVDEARAALLAGQSAPADIAAVATARAAAARAPHLRRVINATGVVLHTNLGRAPLAHAALAALQSVGSGYSNAELDLETGRRGGRLAGVEGLLRELTGAEAALVVNNNAAAVLLALTALARGREVVVSRGELVEIGGSFRVPDVIASGGARLCEVGTTNRTRVSDFKAAVGPDTALLLRVHPSNFRVVGFTERPDRAGLVALARASGVPLVEDLGSGALGPALTAAGGGTEERVEDVVSAGVDLVCFSGDKLLGGPQAGVLAGRRDLVEAARRHPLYRALRVDKLILAALEATLRLYAEGRAAEVPVRAMLTASAADLRPAAERIAEGIPGALVDDDVGFTGGGALPGEGLPTVVVAVRGGDPEALAAALRAGDPPIVARVGRDALLVDPRTLLPGDEPLVVAALARALAPGED